MDDEAQRCADGHTAAQIAREKTIEALADNSLSIDSAIVAIKDALRARIVRVFATKHGDVIYSRPMADHRTRLAAAELALTLHDAIPSQRHQVEHDISGNLMATAAEVYRAMTGAPGVLTSEETSAIIEKTRQMGRTFIPEGDK